MVSFGDDCLAPSDWERSDDFCFDRQQSRQKPTFTVSIRVIANGRLRVFPELPPIPGVGQVQSVSSASCMTA